MGRISKVHMKYCEVDMSYHKYCEEYTPIKKHEVQPKSF
jgi:hypothetical protein